MESQNFGHEHPLVFNEEQSNLSEATDHCSRCGEEKSGPGFSCFECGFCLHKQCAEAPSQINHPFHCKHPLYLLKSPPEKCTGGGFTCHFCRKIGQMFTYHCSSCDLNFHIKCALFTYDISEKNWAQLKSTAYEYASISPENGNEELETAVCFGCWESLSGPVYYSASCGLKLHKKCAELDSEIDYPGHHKHVLILQFNSENLPCMICQETDPKGFFYCCSHCNFVIHVKCLSSPDKIKNKSHPHQYHLFLRQVQFTCDACGVKGNCVPYMCSRCNFLVHKKCISLPRSIKFTWHEHVIFHNYFLRRDESKDWDCVVCRKEVDTEHGSYYCSECHFITHVNCIMEDPESYRIIERDKLKDYLTWLKNMHEDSFIVIEKNESGEATKIKHFSHVHNLMLSNMILEFEGDKYCDGCTLSISDSFYHCLQCNFFLHKRRAEFPKKGHVWFNSCQQQPFLALISGSFYNCDYCEYESNGFAYHCDECGLNTCLRCSIPYAYTYEGHEHVLFFNDAFEGQCKACGEKLDQAYNCKQCNNYALHYNCLLLPLTGRHKCDKHPLSLTYHDDNTYVESHFCDICEEYRNPSHWFYHCADCDTSAHPTCVLGKYSFFKLGTYEGWDDVHPHPLTFVKKMYYYPECFECGERCEDLAVECEEIGCKYIVHWDCIRSSFPSESLADES